MAREQTLLERIGDASTRSLPKKLAEDTEMLRNSVLQHLQKMLNTRQGHTLIQPTYGMPDITGLSGNMPERIREIETAIRTSIEMFEPRLTAVQVNYVVSEEILVVRFEIKATLISEKKDSHIRFETSLRPSGRIEIRG